MNVLLYTASPTPAGYELTWAVIHLGHFLLTKLLMPELGAAYLEAALAPARWAANSLWSAPPQLVVARGHRFLKAFLLFLSRREVLALA